MLLKNMTDGVQVNVQILWKTFARIWAGTNFWLVRWIWSSKKCFMIDWSVFRSWVLICRFNFFVMIFFLWEEWLLGSCVKWAMSIGELLEGWKFSIRSILWFSDVELISVTFVWWDVEEISMLFRIAFLQVKEVCPVDLQMKDVILSSLKNIRNRESFALMNSDLGILGILGF